MLVWMRVFLRIGTNVMTQRRAARTGHMTRKRPLTGSQRSSTEKFLTLLEAIFSFSSPTITLTPVLPSFWTLFFPSDCVEGFCLIYSHQQSYHHHGCCCCPDAHSECHVPLERSRLDAATPSLLQVPGGAPVRVANVNCEKGTMLMGFLRADLNCLLSPLSPATMHRSVRDPN